MTCAGCSVGPQAQGVCVTSRVGFIAMRRVLLNFAPCVWWRSRVCSLCAVVCVNHRALSLTESSPVFDVDI